MKSPAPSFPCEESVHHRDGAGVTNDTRELSEPDQYADICQVCEWCPDCGGVEVYCDKHDPFAANERLRRALLAAGPTLRAVGDSTVKKLCKEALGEDWRT